MLKTARLGYDGKGQIVIRNADHLDQIWQELGQVEAVLETFIPLKSEISVIVARDQHGETRAYPPGENHHDNQILATTVVPARIDQGLQDQAIEQAITLAKALDYIGVLGVEFFIAEDNQLYFNEMAPRPHNSGHWTQDAAITSQFEQQIRAVTGLPLGPVTQICPVIMENLLGETPDRVAKATRHEDGKLHLYGKAEAREGRKMGHINWLHQTTLV
ncbi:MAG: ATP-grasp domain-containing protein [Pseudomonadota bacterium]